MTDTIDPATARRVLDLPMPDNDANAATIRDYLIEIVAEVWNKGEFFSGKRPFGNSCWWLELFQPLVTAGLVTGRLDEDGDIDDLDEPTATRLIAAAIRELR